LRERARFDQVRVDALPRLRVPVPVRADHHVGADQRPGLSVHAVAHALDHRPQRDDGGDADGDADEEEQQAPPRRPRLPNGHAKDEAHI
jgi:hypothetical protein